MAHIAAVGTGQAQGGVLEPGHVVGDTGAGVLNALPGPHHDGVLHGHRAGVGSRHGFVVVRPHRLARVVPAGLPQVHVPGPGVTALGAGHAGGGAPGGVAAPVGVHDGRYGADTPGVQLLRVPLVAGREGVAAVVGQQGAVR